MSILETIASVDGLLCDGSLGLGSKRVLGNEKKSNIFSKNLNDQVF